MELVLAAIIWNAKVIHYAPMSLAQCEAMYSQSIANWHPRIGMKQPLIECMKAKWSCERGFVFAEPKAPATN